MDETLTADPVICRCPGCKREAPADISHWRCEFGERPAPYAMREKILICPDCGNREVQVVNAWWEVELDETKLWDIDAADQPYIERIVGVYLVNRAERTYLCTSTPSYWLRCVGNCVRLKEGVPDEEPDYFGSRLQDKYENNASMKDSDGYHDCADVDRLPADQLFHHADIEAESYDEAAREIDGGWVF